MENDICHPPSEDVQETQRRVYVDSTLDIELNQGPVENHGEGEAMDIAGADKTKPSLTGTLENARNQPEVAVVHMPPHLEDKDLKFSANKMRLLHKIDCIAVINRLCNIPIAKSRMNIPLCRLICCPLVRPIIEQDVQKLENEFVKGYRDGDRVMYVSLYDMKDDASIVTEQDEFCSNHLWKGANDRFEATLLADPNLHQFRNKYFYV